MVSYILNSKSQNNLHNCSDIFRCIFLTILFCLEKYIYICFQNSKRLLLYDSKN